MITDLTSHLRDRHLDLELHKPILDHDECVAIFLLWNLSGQVTGFQQYRPNANKVRNNDPHLSRYFTKRPKGVISIWGLESLHLTPAKLFITEGIFDAARLTERGYSAIAVLSNDPSSDVRSWVRLLNRDTIAVTDADAAGRMLASVASRALVCEAGKDLGDAPDEYVDQLLKEFG
jgi:hypothetical protein